MGCRLNLSAEPVSCHCEEVEHRRSNLFKFIVDTKDSCSEIAAPFGFAMTGKGTVWNI